MQEVELVGRTGEEADPARHCIRKKVSSQEPANCVVAVEREGVRWEGRLLRAADVTISGGLDAVV
jgi:molecular chaperone GrpE (heat shock protein)